MIKKKNVLLYSVFYGSLWGLAEAVLGYLLHLIPFSVSGFIMFPIGFYFMMRSYKYTQDLNSILLVGTIAAVIKLADLAMPFLPVIKTVVPSASILFEAIVVTVAYGLFKEMRSKISVPGIVAASLGWRLLFLLLQYVLTLFSIKSGLIAGGLQSILSFVLLEGLVNAVILFFIMRFAGKTTQAVPEKRLNPFTAVGTLLVSMAVTVAVTLL